MYPLMQSGKATADRAGEEIGLSQFLAAVGRVAS